MTKPRFMLDSNICIYVLHGGSERVRARIEANAPGEVVTSAIAYAEVMRGVPQDRAKEKRAEAFFREVAVLPFGSEAARTYRAIPFRRGTFDRLIAAHALALGVVFVTNNDRDYDDVPGLRIENWTLS